VLPGIKGGAKSGTARQAALREGGRVMTICNACRYCEGYCAVFPAMEHRITFQPDDLEYLANLCHNCAECYDACQYAPPHEFAVDVPRAFAEIRRHSYLRLPVGLAAAISVATFLAVAAVEGMIGHSTMVAVFGTAAVFVLAAGMIPLRLRKRAVLDALTLRYMNPEHDKRRGFYHHWAFYGFLLCFAATSVAAFYHYFLHYRAPYPILSAPVILGTMGGAGLLAGTAGMYVLRRDYSDTGFIALLFFTSLTGFLVLALRETPALRWLLAIHLGVALALFATMPYGKFVHGFHRLRALARYHRERALPTSES